MHPSKNKDSLKTIYHTEICKIHKISSVEMKNTIEKLHENTALNADLQKEVLDSLNALQSRKFANSQKPLQ